MSNHAGGAGGALLGAAHPGPAVAVTVLVGAYAVAVDLTADRAVLVTVAVLAGQLSIGWSNDLLDAARDRAVGRTDKPLARGDRSGAAVRAVRAACVLAVVVAAVLSALCGLPAAAVHALCVSAGWAYNLGVKSTLASWLPYAVAFGGYPAVATLAHPDPALPPVAVVVAGALLGVGAHLVNVLPDLADDAATGVRGLPHVLGARWTSVLAVAALAAATVALLAVAEVPWPVVAGVLVLVAGLVLVALLTDGRTPFRAAVGIALVDVTMLVVAG